MTSHDLANQLLELPDAPVFVYDVVGNKTGRVRVMFSTLDDDSRGEPTVTIDAPD